jgi:SAM-dependent methyltransferase
MCNANCIIFGATMLSKAEVEGKRVIEVGSYCVDGSLRPIIESWSPGEYVGVDIQPGPGVDVLCPAEKLVEEFGKDSFDVVISTCVLEHIKNWKESVSNMKNVCKPNGILLIIVPSEWAFHAFPHDYWRFTKEDMINIFEDCNIAILKEDDSPPSLVYAKIIKNVNFVEKDLTGYQIYSIILNERTGQINDIDYERFIRKVVIKTKITDFIKKIGTKLFS